MNRDEQDMQNTASGSVKFEGAVGAESSKQTLVLIHGQTLLATELTAAPIRIK